MDLAYRRNIALLILILVTSSEGRFVRDAINQFSVELLQTMQQRGTTKVVVSPFSIYALLAFIQQGSHGITREELTNVLHNSPSDNLVGFHNITQNLLSSETLFGVLNGGAFKGEYIKKLPAFYDRSIQNFLTNFGPVFYFLPRPTGLYDDWMTLGRNRSSITEFITEVSVEKDDQDPRFLMLSNKITFEGFWKKPFEETSMIYHLDPDHQKNVSALSQELLCVGGISKKLGFKWIRIELVLQKPKLRDDHSLRPVPLWDDKDISLLLILPIEKFGLSEILKNMTYHRLKNLSTNKENTKLAQILLPKFDISNIKNLIPTMKQMGMNSLFGESPDLGGIVTYFQKVPGFRSTINLSVDKMGVRTKKIASTILPNFKDKMTSTDKTMDFTANEPFLYFIMDNSNTIPIIAGKMTDPLIGNKS